MATWRDVSPEDLKRLEKMEGKVWQATSAGDINKHIDKPSKYRNQKTDGFDSKKEARRAEELRMMEKAGIIRNLRYQVPYLLQEAFRGKDGVWNRKIEYVADFVYEDRLQADWIEIVEDAKGFKHEVYRIKKKLLLHKYPDINFIET